MAANERHEWAMIRVSEILRNLMRHHEEAIEWLQKAIVLFSNLKARVMLISYEFYELNNNLGYDRNVHNFTLLQNLVDQGTEMEKPSSIDVDNETDQRNREERLFMRKNEVGLALYVSGQCYELGRGTSPQLTTAKYLYQRSVFIAQHVEAMWRLGVVYSSIENDDISALEWFRKAAETSNHCDSHYQLGLFHLNGLAGLGINITASKKILFKSGRWRTSKGDL